MIEPISILEIVTTVSNETEARTLAMGGVESGLVACSQIDGPITSIYRWEGAIQTASEFRVTMKVSVQNKKTCLEWLTLHHPYQTPEVILRVVESSEKYADWVDGRYAERSMYE
jgi:periplasmic divalent cation tolerance protein